MPTSSSPSLRPTPRRWVRAVRVVLAGLAAVAITALAFLVAALFLGFRWGVL